MKQLIHRLLALSALSLALSAGTARADSFSDDYEGDLSDYTINYSGQIVVDPLQPGNHALSFFQVRGGGDAFGPWIDTTPGQDLVLTFDYLGDINGGDPDGLNLGGFIGVTWTGGENWLGGTGGWPTTQLLIDDGQWHSYSIPFTAEATQIRVFIEDWDTGGTSIPGDAYFDNVRIGPAIDDAAAQFNTTTNTDSSLWSYRYRIGTTEDGNYPLLTVPPGSGPDTDVGDWYDAVTNAPAPEPGAWNAASSAYPFIAANPGEQDLWPYGLGVLPIGTLLIAPPDQGLAVLSWRASAAMTATPSYRFADLQACGDGVDDGIRWVIEHRNADGVLLETIGSGEYASGGSTGSGVTQGPPVNVAAGDRINFVVSSKSTYTCDEVLVIASIVRGAANPDTDGDGVNDAGDNCPAVANADQTDTDGDGQGNACDSDNDNDGVPDATDNCQFTSNAGQADADGDGLGDACDADADGDGVTQAGGDNCPLLPNADQTDTDDDGIGDDCDTDDDSDGICDDTVGGCTDGLIARWALNGDGSDSFANHDGTTSGNVTWVAGHSGEALHVAGDGYLEGNIPTLPQGAAPRTFAAWIWIDQPHQGTIFNYGTFASNQRAGMLYISGRLYWVGEFNDVMGNIVVPVGEWAHVAITYDSASVIRLYVNGQLDTTQAITPHATTGTGWRIGNGVDIDYFREAFQGRIDDVSVYGRALSGSEIASLHAGTCAGCTGGPDNCPTVENPDQADQDGDHVGDACDNDVDGDGFLNAEDHCPTTASASNDDTDGDGAGDACDPDDDGDGVVDASDNCPLVANADQADLDGDGAGDACDPDRDGDGVGNDADNCADVANTTQGDVDGDSIGDACDPDRDGDGVANDSDNCPDLANSDQSNIDFDEFGDVCDDDADGDGAAEGSDNCPVVPNADQADLDGDGVGDACDSDIDGDGIPNSSDNCPFVVSSSNADTDGDGLGDACDPDDDNDGVADATDNCPLAANVGQADFDGDGAGDACDDDDDDDGVLDTADTCPQTAAGEIVNAGGCSIAQLCPCSGPQGSSAAWRNHGKYVSCTAGAANQFLAAGLITQAEKDATVSSAGQSGCGN